MDAMQRQILAMQKELQNLRRQSAEQKAQTQAIVQQARVPQRSGPTPLISKDGVLPAIVEADLACGSGSYALGNRICFTPGGFIELAGIYRTPNEAADVGSDFGGIPFRNSPLSRESEFRFSARQSRLSGLFTGMVDPTIKVSAYYEFDFLGAGVTSNSRESNSYVPRIRQVFASIDSLDNGWHFLAGQAWSLITTNTAGITPLKEQIPLTIDAQYVPGFNWSRNPQIRIVKDVAPGLWAGLSLESPQSVLPPSPFAAPANVNLNNIGDAAGLLNNSTTYSNNSAPDIIGKLAFEPGFGHYELKGLVRFFDDRLIATNLNATTRLPGRTETAMGYGIGGSASFPVLPSLLDVQLSGLYGQGIGRYGSSQLPDFALKADGTIATIPMFQLLAGVVGHVQPGTDVYAYAGWEHAQRTGALSLVGYGSPTLVNSGCDIEGASASTCQAESRNVWQVTAGFWHDLYKGSYGRVVAGAQGSYTTREAFRGAAGLAPSTNMVVGLVSLRYYPF
ncbi:hypothetical protein [Methylobacterium sp. NEAU K]|uniref:hypothetical protein n=1 Tax=Methylobacterium sp. NEAU K TaxID=3064946 RepID=UPI002732852C|nr:hypothetical protein [Methylobacterium sp. NEAU K]MDP4006626.1 hypothetical protein [Methylobacterium sp. NEAU K]